MRSESSIELAIAAITMMTEEGGLEKVQVQRLLRIAFEDGMLDEAEQGILTQVFSHVVREQVTDETWQLIELTRFRCKL